MTRRALALFLASLALAYSSLAFATTWEELKRQKSTLPTIEELNRRSRELTQGVKKEESKKEEKTEASALERGIVDLYRDFNPSLSLEAATKMAKSTITHCTERGVDSALLAGIIIVESRANPRARNKSMLGLCQIHWKVHAASIKKAFPHIKTVEDMLQADNNIQVGSWILQRYLEKGGGSVDKALGYYLGSKNTKYIKRVKEYRDRVLNFS